METETPLKIYFLPFLSPSHLIPLSEIATLFATQGQQVTIITTPSNATVIHESSIISSNPLSISVHEVEFPGKQVGLPEGLETFCAVSDFETAAKLYTAMDLMQSEIESFVISNPPDCIISDAFFPWTADLAIKLGIPRLAFQGFCVFAQLMEQLLRPSNVDAPHMHVQSDHEPFEVPGLPDRVIMTRSQLPEHARSTTGFAQVMEQWREAELKSYGVLINSIYEIEPAYAEIYSKLMGHKVWHIGPANLVHRNSAQKFGRGPKTIVDQQECLTWLDSKQHSSVLYVFLGTGCPFPDEQLLELASALALSGTQFIWVVLRKGVQDRIEEIVDETKKGMIIRGWAPQAMILDHPSIGGFLTHCGWNSIMEAISCGVPMITWPSYAEQFYNEKLVVQVMKIGVEIGAKEWNLGLENGAKKVIMGMDKIVAAVRRLMDGGDEAIEVRKRAEEFGEMARNAVKEGGSSQQNLIALIQDLKRLRSSGVVM